jgi:hypothetical protein
LLLGAYANLAEECALRGIGRGGMYGSIQPSSSRGRLVAFGGDVCAAEHSVSPSGAVMIAASVDPDTVRVGAVDLLP